MGIASVLVHVDRSEHIDRRVAVAIDLAKSHEAHLAAIYAMPDPLIFPYATGEYIPAEIIESQIKLARESAASAKARFEKQMEHSGLDAEWREAEGYPADVVSLNAKYADIGECPADC